MHSGDGLEKMMPVFTIDDMRRILRQCAGDPDSVDLDSDVHDVQFEEMGYDSLALMEMAARIQEEFAVPIPDDLLEQLHTPAEVIQHVNSAGEVA
jgi:minimal PKS acyl carrier protein